MQELDAGRQTCLAGVRCPVRCRQGVEELFEGVDVIDVEESEAFAGEDDIILDDGTPNNVGVGTVCVKRLWEIFSGRSSQSVQEARLESESCAGLADDFGEE